MRSIETIEDDIFAIRALIQDAIRENDQREVDALYNELDMLMEEVNESAAAI